MSNQENTTPGAIISALASPTVPAGTVPRAKLPKKSDLEKELAKRSKPVRIDQPPAGRWRCDGCLLSGKGGKVLLAHAAVTGHLRYTDLGYR